MGRSIHAASNDVLRHGEKRNIEEYFYRPHIFRETKYQRTVGKQSWKQTAFSTQTNVDTLCLSNRARSGCFRADTSPGWENSRGFPVEGKEKKRKKKSLWIFPFSRFFFLRAVEKCFTLEEIFSLSGKIDFLSLSLSLSTSIDSFQFFKPWHNYPFPLSPDFCDSDFIFLNYPRERIFNRCPLNRLPLLLARRREREKERDGGKEWSFHSFITELTSSKRKRGCIVALERKSRYRNLVFVESFKPAPFVFQLEAKLCLLRPQNCAAPFYFGEKFRRLFVQTDIK